MHRHCAVCQLPLCLLLFLKATYDKKKSCRKFLTVWEDFDSGHLRLESADIQDASWVLITKLSGNEKGNVDA